MGDQDHGGHSHHGAGGFQEELLELALHSSSWFGCCVLMFGMGTAVLNYGLLMVQHLTGFKFNIIFAVTQKRNSPLTLDRIKLELAQMVGFSLLLLVAVDVLETLAKPGHEYEMEELYKMGLIGAIRTTLAYFLGKEMEEIMHHIAHHEHGHSEDHGAHKTEEKKAIADILEEEDSKPNERFKLFNSFINRMRIATISWPPKILCLVIQMLCFSSLEQALICLLPPACFSSIIGMDCRLFGCVLIFVCKLFAYFVSRKSL